MGTMWKFICTLLSTLAIHVLYSTAQNGFTPGMSISVNQTFISTGGSFVLGFFTPSNDSTIAATGTTKDLYYLGIWYNNHPERTVVWVANRDKPLISSSGIFKIVEDGNLAVLDREGGAILWSTNITASPRKNTSAALLDTGNLVLLLKGGDGELWQSFDHPTDTLLPGMKLRYNFKNAAPQRLYPWKNSQDPSPGEAYAGFDSNSPLQMVVRRGSMVVWRYGIWNGKTTLTSRLDNSSTLWVETLVVNDQELYYTFAATELAAVIRIWLDPNDTITTSIWNERATTWIQNSVSSLPCEQYNRCGSFGACVGLGLGLGVGQTPSCQCLQGFDPRNQTEWDMGNYTGGCVRQTALDCGGGRDQFVLLSNMKPPDNFLYLRNKSEVQCEAECSNSCHCTAYAYSNMSSATVTDLRCLIWYGELKDLAVMLSIGGDLYLRLAATSGATPDKDGSSANKRTVVLATVLPSVFLIILLTLSCYFLRRHFKIKDWKISRVGGNNLNLYSRNKDNNISESEKGIKGLASFNFSIVSEATDGFSAANRLGAGGFGPVYKGRLSSGQEIAVKRLSKTSGQGLQEFKNEIKLISSLQHRNLVQLLGWCTFEDEKILIYEYLPNKSLDKFIFDPNLSKELDWSRRYCIVEGVSQGLLYLHRYSRLRIIHRDLKTSNILLDISMNPKISDFGLAKIFFGDQTEANTNRVVGTYGYMSPEYALDGRFSEKSDVFGFGVILLEIVTGKRSTGFYPYKESISLLGYAWQLWQEGRCLELIDPSMGSSYSAEEVLKCVQVGLLCIQEDVDIRPSMPSVVAMLTSHGASLPIPRLPIFALGRQLNHVQINSSPNHATSDSSSLPTNSVLEGR